MKNNLLKASLIVFCSFVFLAGCNQTEKAKIENNQIEIAKETFAIATIENNKTKYADGRFTAVRNLEYYNSQVKTSIPMKDSKLGLTTIMTEWNAYDANVASAEAAFIEVPRSIEERDKVRAEMKAAGVDLSTDDGNSTMIGGDEETNRRFVEPSKRYWAVASKVFEQEFTKLKKAKSISDRSVDYVTFDFITTNGFYTVQVKKSELESSQSVWSNLFEESKFLNTEMARVQNESAIDAQQRYEAKQLKKNQKIKKSLNSNKPMAINQ
jgi:uncharacterized protein with FMN-binding domain